MPSKDKKKAIKKLKRLVYSPKESIDTFRKRFEDTLYTPFLPNRVECETIKIGGVSCDVLQPDLYSKERVMLYIHGGCFVAGSCKSYRAFCASLAYASNTKIILPKLPLAPKYPYPVAIENVKKIVHTLYKKEEQILLGADGSAASIALALAFSIKKTYRTKLQQIILFSPWLDISSDSEITKISKKKTKDKIIKPEKIHRCAELYTYESNHKNPRVSPMYATKEMLTGLPEIYIQMGQEELLGYDVNYFLSKLKQAKVPYTIDVWKEMVYLFQMADEFFKESHLAMETVGNHIKKTEPSASLSRYRDVPWN